MTKSNLLNLVTFLWFLSLIAWMIFLYLRMTEESFLAVGFMWTFVFARFIISINPDNN